MGWVSRQPRGPAATRGVVAGGVVAGGVVAGGGDVPVCGGAPAAVDVRLLLAPFTTLEITPSSLIATTGLALFSQREFVGISVEIATSPLAE